MDFNEDYKGAGILPYSIVEGGINFLFQTTFHGKKMGTLVDFGGYRESENDPIITASREFSEETGGLFTAKNYEDYLDTIKEMSEKDVQLSQIVFEQTNLVKSKLKNCKFSWTQNKQYYMFFMPIEFRPTTKISECFEINKKKREFIWVDAKGILNDSLPMPLHERVQCITNLNNIIVELCNCY